MESMPPVILGARILVPFALAYTLRREFERRFVLKGNMFSRTMRQFQLDFTLLVLAGGSVAVYSSIIHGFPWSGSVSLFFGTLVLGFFIALDMALWRERRLIYEAKTQPPLLLSPERLYPMSRRFSMVAVATAIFVIEIMAAVISRDFAWLDTMVPDAAMINAARRSVMIEVTFVTVVLLGIVINLIASYSKNLKLLFGNETSVLEKVSQGDLSNLVPVVTQDEFGLIAGHTNNMIHGLRHRLELMTSIRMADQVQRNLLPVAPPRMNNIDVAGASIYCKKTGGDYFDYFELASDRLGIVVADAAGHGVESAMQMTSTRAFLRSAMDRYVDPSQIVSEVNGYLTRDSRDSGRFVSLFFLEINLKQRMLRWVRAGHDPALLYTPGSGRLHALDGSGVVLGVSEQIDYVTRIHEDWPSGTVVVIGTDGIWEARNEKGEMFGKERLITAIKKSSAQQGNARHLLDQILSQVADWRNHQDQEDDVTLVTAILP